MKVKAMKRFLSAFLALFMLATLMPVSMPQTAHALSDEDISATVELGKGFNLLAGKTFEAGNLQSAPIFKSMENMNPTKTRLGDVESKMTYITSMSSYLDNTHTDISVDVGVSTDILMAKTDIKAKFGFKGSWESEGSTNKSRLILEILAKAYKYSMNINQGDPWAKDDEGNYVTLNDKFAKDLMNMSPKAFFNTYGTHIITQYDAGGEAYTSYEGTDTSNSMKSEFDIETNVEVGTSTKKIAAVNVAVSASGGEKHEDSFAETSSQMSMRVRGGDPMYSTFDKIISGDADETVNAWLASMYGMDENTGSTKSTMIKTDNMQLFAMWDLLAMDKSQSHTARIEELKKYYMDNVKEEIVDMYQEFIYGIPTNFADEYAQVYSEIVTDEELGSVDAIPEGFLPIRTEDDLMKMKGNKNYILLNDIEITDDFIHAAVDYDEFTGIFDGNGHTISGLQLIDTKGKYIGLFPVINEGAVIKNLVIKDAEIVIESEEGQTVYAGILCGTNTDGLTGSDLGKIMDVRIEDSSITIKGGAGTTYLGGIVGYTDSRSDNNNDRALQRATVKNCVIKNERAGTNSAVGGITGYHKGEGGWAMLRVASYDNEISSAEGYAGGVIGRSSYQRGSYVFGAGNSPDNGYIGYLENSSSSSNASYEKIFTVGEEDFALGADFEIFEAAENWLTSADESHLWTYTGEWDDLPEPVFNTAYPYLIVHAPGGIKAFKDATLGTNDIKVYYAADPADKDTYEDVTDYVNYFYDFSEVGMTTVAAVYGNKTIEFEVEVLEPVVKEANIINTGKTEYKIGEVFTIDDFVGQLVYSNTFTENVFKTNAEFVVTIPELEGDTPIVPDEYVMDYEIDSAKVIVKYGDVEFTYDISVAEADPEGKIQFKANSVKVASGQSFVLDVHMSGNPGILALKSTLEFNEDVFELIGVTDNNVFDAFEESKYKDNEGNIVYDSPYQLYWSSPYAEVDNEYNGKLISFEFDVKEAANLSDEIIRFNFVEAFDKDGNPVGGVSSKFAVDVCEVKVGDVDGSDRVNIWDAVLLRQHYFDGSDAKLLMDASDTNYDGNKTSVDSTYLNRYVVGLYGYYGAYGTPGRYKVNFKGNGFEDFTEYLTVGSTLPTPPVANSGSFHGWYDNPEFEGNPITDVTLWTGGEFNLWAKVGYPIYYNLSSRSPEDFINYDELPTWYYCDEENPFKLDFALEADGLTFKGWKDSYYEIPADGFTEMPGTLYLTPQYTGNTYDIYARIYLEGHVDITEKIGTYEYTMLSSGSTIDKRLVSNLAPKIAGYVGGDIYKDAEFNEICGVNTYYVSTPYLGYGEVGDFYLYYKYEPMKYNITFDWGYEGAPETEGITYEYGAEGFKLPTTIPARSGYKFAGWNLVYTDMYGRNFNLPVTRTEYDKYWLLDYVTAPVIDVEFVAQWMESSKGATISAINSITGLTTRYSFDPTADFQMPEGPEELILVDGVYYAFEGWYSTPEMAEEDRVTVIYANTFNEDNNKYYSKWVATTTGTIIVHDRITGNQIGTITATAGTEFPMPDATEYVKEVVGGDYISDGAFYILDNSSYTAVSTLTVDFSKKHVYVDVIDVSNMVANIFTVNHTYTWSSSPKLGVELDGSTYEFEPVKEERVYTIYTPADKISVFNILNTDKGITSNKADITYRAEYGSEVIVSEKTLRYSGKSGGLERTIYTPIIKDEYTLELYAPTFTAEEMPVYSGYSGRVAINQKITGLNLLDGYPVKAAREGKITLPVLEDLSVNEYGGTKWQEYLTASGVSEEDKATLKLKFVGWFERPYYTQPNEKPITEIDASLLTQDVQLYAIYEPVRTLYKYDSTWKIWDLEVAKNLIKCVYVLWDNANAKLYDTSEIANGRLVKAMPNFAAPSYILRDFRNSVNVYHPYSLSSTSKATLYSTTSSSYDTSKNTTGVEYFYVYLDGNKLPSSYMPDPSTTVLTAEE